MKARILGDGGYSFLRHHHLPLECECTVVDSVNISVTEVELLRQGVKITPHIDTTFEYYFNYVDTIDDEKAAELIPEPKPHHHHWWERE